tara:strand:+ start:236 stop:895 length:660 start_codon:yes stop_codon:yes gene_type:complete
MSKRDNRPTSESGRAEDQFGFLMNKNYSQVGGRSGAKYRSQVGEGVNMTPGQNYLSNFIYGKDNQRKGKLNPFGINLPDFGMTEAVSGVGSKVAGALRSPEVDPNQTQLGQPFNQQEFFDNLRGLEREQSKLRDYESGREARRQLDLFKQTMPLVDIAAETAAQRRLMEDRSSPTKISQQILRARQGEAALMNATANQLQTAALASAQGIAPRGRAGGR